jgi:hypothetical protein
MHTASAEQRILSDTIVVVHSQILAWLRWLEVSQSGALNPVTLRSFTSRDA